MDCPACANDPCTCQTERLPNPSTVIRSTYQPVPLGITKEEFGLNLYEAIKLISALKTIREQLNYTRLSACGSSGVSRASGSEAGSSCSWLSKAAQRRASSRWWRPNSVFRTRASWPMAV